MEEYQVMQGIDVVDRLLAMLDMNAGNGCWEWTGHRTNGYGHMRVFGKRTLSHRLMLEIVLERPLRPDEFCRHKCDNPGCCNPDHLEAGSHLQNMRDAVKRGRFQRGSGHHGAKLTEEIVAEARRRYAVGDIAIGTLADEYGVCYIVMRDAITGVTWKSVSTSPVPAFSYTRFLIGQTNPNAKLSELDVRDIRERVASGENHSEVARLYRIKPCTVRSIIYRRSWKHLD